MKKAPLVYQRNFDRLPGSHDFRLGLAALVPHGASVKAFLAVFDGRASMSAINHWRYGTRHAPQWARELLAAKLEAAYRNTHPLDLAARLRQMPAGPGLAAGARNLAEWKARKNRDPIKDPGKS
jgi:hypothetical protein